MDMLKERMISNFKRLLKERGVSERKLCEGGELTHGALRAALGNRNDSVSSGLIVKISQALGVDPSELCAPPQ